MNRITERDLKAVVDRINQATRSPQDSYTKLANGQYRANVGNYHLSYAYGGVSLHRMVNDGGGVDDVFRCGHQTKRDLYNRMQAFIDGLATK